MAYQDSSITPKLLESAKREFKLYGFEKASINVICKNAQITTGALYKRFSTKEELFNSFVEDPAEQLREMLIEEYRYYHTLSRSEQMDTMFSNWLGKDKFVKHIYRYSEEFLMILNLSSGTKYENYFEEISEIITNSTILFIRNNNRGDIEDFVLKDLVHILVSSYVKGILEPLVHEMSFKKAQIHIEYFKRFFYIGWKDLLKM